MVLVQVGHLLGLCPPPWVPSCFWLSTLHKPSHSPMWIFGPPSFACDVILGSPGACVRVCLPLLNTPHLPCMAPCLLILRLTFVTSLMFHVNNVLAADDNQYLAPLLLDAGSLTCTLQNACRHIPINLLPWCRLAVSVRVP